MNEHELNEHLKQRAIFTKSIFSKLPTDAEIEMFILKGHLAIEEILYKSISDHVHNFQWIKNAKLSFNQLVCLLRAMNKMPELDKIYTSIVIINKIRNKCAHQLINNELNDSLSDLRNNNPELSSNCGDDIIFFKASVTKIITTLSILAPINATLINKSKDEIIEKNITINLSEIKKTFSES